MRKSPTPRLLVQTVTLYNLLPKGGAPINGGYSDQYQRTVLKNVKYVQSEGAITVSSHGAVSDSLHLIIFPDMATVTDGRTYIDPVGFASLDDTSAYWTLQKGMDYIALGEQTMEKPSTEGSGRNDFRMTSVDIRYYNGDINHFEVNAN